MLDALGIQWRNTNNRRLQIEREQQLANERQYRARIAAIEREQKEKKERQRQTNERDVVGLLNEGYSIDQTSYILDIPLSEVARIAKYNQGRRKFLMTGKLDLPGEMVGITIPS